MVVIEDLMGLQDYRIQFTTGEGAYEGTISRIAMPEILIIRNLIWLPKNSKMGTLIFRANEISSFKIIGKSESPKPNFSVNAPIYCKDSQKYTLADYELDDNITDDDESESKLDMFPEEPEYELKLPPDLIDVLPIDYAEIGELKKDFDCAITHIKRQDMIGLSLESPKIGRREKLFWLCISTASCTFFFDIHKLGESGFNNGLKSVLEEATIEKVVHDCREMSDCLYHQFNTRLVNVFDTQVADFIITMQRSKRKPDHHVSSLNSCLSQYLNVPLEFLFCRKQRSYHDEVVFYGLRPLVDDLKDLFIKNVIYLRRLKQELDCLLVEPLNKGIDFYLKAVQSKTEKELQLEEFNPIVCPTEFLYSDIQILRFKNYVEIPSIVSSGPPFRRLDSRFNAFFDYCEKYKIGESDTKDEEDILLCEGGSATSVQDIGQCGNSEEKDSSNEDPWEKLRKAFASLGPVNDDRKIRFIPAGME